MRFAVLGSGSKGNALLVEAGGTHVLIDAGIPPKELRRRLRSLDVELKDLDALVITHGHGDHIAAAPVLAGAMRLLTYCTAGTRDVCASRRVLQNTVVIEPGVPFSVGPLRFCAFRTPHDIAGSVGYVVDDGDERFGLCTDLGRADKRVARALRDCDALLLEFNHDPEMLKTGPYPEMLKRRVAGPLGHLSNEDAGQILQWARTSLLRRVLLGHLSETNNLPRLAKKVALEVVDGADVEVAVAPQHHPTGWLRVGKERARRPYRTPMEFITPRAVAGTGAPNSKPVVREATFASAAGASSVSSAAVSARGRPGARRPPVRIAEPALAVSRQLALFGGGKGEAS